MEIEVQSIQVLVKIKVRWKFNLCKYRLVGNRFSGIITLHHIKFYNHTLLDKMNTDLQDELINFMFLRRPDAPLDVMACLRLWFGKSTSTDIEIRTRFGEHVELALKGHYEHWRSTPRGCIALMILLDQFPRNMYRHTVDMYAGDKAGRAIVDAGHDWMSVLKPEECLFVPCLIPTHQENVADQQACLRFGINWSHCYQQSYTYSVPYSKSTSASLIFAGISRTETTITAVLHRRLGRR